MWRLGETNNIFLVRTSVEDNAGYEYILLLYVIYMVFCMYGVITFYWRISKIHFCDLYSLLSPYLYTLYSLLSPYLYTLYSLLSPYLYTLYSLLSPYLYTLYSLLSPTYTLFTLYSPPTYTLFTLYSPPTYTLFFYIKWFAMVCSSL